MNMIRMATAGQVREMYTGTPPSTRPISMPCPRPSSMSTVSMLTSRVRANVGAVPYARRYDDFGSLGADRSNDRSDAGGRVPVAVAGRGFYDVPAFVSIPGD